MIVPAAVVVTLIICSVKKSNNVNDEGTTSGSSDNNSICTKVSFRLTMHTLDSNRCTCNTVNAPARVCIRLYSYSSLTVFFRKVLSKNHVHYII